MGELDLHPDTGEVVMKAYHLRETPGVDIARFSDVLASRSAFLAAGDPARRRRADSRMMEGDGMEVEGRNAGSGSDAGRIR
jgi:hypothetical protein